MNPLKKNPYTGLAVASLLALSTMGTARANAQCSDPGLKRAGTLYVDGSFGHNGYATQQQVLLPLGVVRLDDSFRQTSLKAFGGGSDSRSPLQPSQIPAGICIVANGAEDHEKGWAVSYPSLRVTSDDGERVTQRGFAMNLYCTVGSNEADRFVGGCNAKVDVYYKPLAVVATVKPHKQHSTR